MATKGIVPVKLRLTEGDFYTLWAPSWREHGAEWQAFLGHGEKIFAFESPAALLGFLESGAPHDLSSHPKWSAFSQQPADRVVPGEREEFDIVGTPGLLAQRPSHANVSAVARNFRITRSLGEVAGDNSILIFFGSHSVLSNPERGVEHFSGDAGLREWTAIGRVVLANWDAVVDAADSLVSVLPAENLGDAEQRIEAAQQERKQAEEEKKAAEKEKVDPYDETIWAAAGIDPIKVSIEGSTVYTLRTYLAGQPVFLGRYGEIFTFPSSKTLARWIVQNNEHDLARVSTWEDILTLANAGELELTVHPDNVYSFNGIVRDIRKGPSSVDTQQMSRAYELLADAADWAADDSLNSFFLAHPRMQDYISYLLGSQNTSGYTPTAPFDEHAENWAELEQMLIKRFSKF